MTEVPATRRGDAFPYTNAAMTPDVSDETLAPSPRPPYFDTAANAWVLTRYDEVLAAFRSTRLWPVSPRGEWDDQPRLTDGSLVERRDVRDALAASRLAAWMRDIETAATAQLAQLPNDLPIELVGDFGKPFAMDVALLVTGTDPRHRAE